MTDESDESVPWSEPDDQLNGWSKRVIGAAIAAHRELGPGLDELTYGNALALEFLARDIPFQREVWIDVIYRDEVVGRRRMDFIIADSLIIEIKAVEQLLSLHKAQALTYLKLTGHKLALLINFNVEVLKDGIRRVVRS